MSYLDLFAGFFFEIQEVLSVNIHTMITKSWQFRVIQLYTLLMFEFTQL